MWVPTYFHLHPSPLATLTREPEVSMRRSIVGLATLLLLLVSASVCRASTPTVLYNFCSVGECLDGSHPVGDLVSDENGNLYGTTSAGGSNNLGTVFALCAPGALAPPVCAGSLTYTEIVLHSFTGSPADGATPLAGLVYEQISGNLYGTTSAGGSGSCSGGCGTVFAINSDGGTLTVLHNFLGGTDGATPKADLLEDSFGNFYGTTSLGGSGSCGQGCGTVFTLNPGSSTYTVTYSLHGSPDGANAVAGLAVDSTGNLWGTAKNGGKANLGSIFELTTGGTLVYTRSFAGKTDGANPAAALAFDPAIGALGTFYGTTEAGGAPFCSGGCGTVFELQPHTMGSPAYNNFYQFTGAGPARTGSAPIARLTVDTGMGDELQHYVYGTASLGGKNTGACPSSGCGTAFLICPPTISCPVIKRETTLFAFDGTHGANPASSLLIDLSLLPQSHENTRFPPPGRPQCTSNCIGTGQNDGENGGGVVVALTD